MERREQYDPEDIESLLTERSFDELLAEERAFVLRHLSGRDEYEQMRALLHYVRPDERSRPSIEPEDRVRTNVLAAFRAQQQPQWRVWLNSISAWLAPGDSFAFWRPALAFGSLALLIVAGVVAVRQFGNEAGVTELAELKEIPGLEKNEAPVTPAADLEVMDSVGPPVPKLTETGMAAVSASANKAAAENTSVIGTVEADRESPSLDLMEMKDIPQFTPATTDAVMEPMEDLAAATAKKEVNENSFSSATVSGVAPATTGHVVTQEELVRNESFANVSEVSKASKTRKKQAPGVEKALDEVIIASRSLGQDPALMGLINSGW